MILFMIHSSSSNMEFRFSLIDLFVFGYNFIGHNLNVFDFVFWLQY